MWRYIILYGFVVAGLVVIMNWLDFHFLMHSLSMEIYLGLVALIFAFTGGWIGWRYTRPSMAGSAQIETTSDVPTTELTNDTSGLSPRELEVLELIAMGFSNQEIADKLFVSLNTVKSHSSNLFLKLDVKRRTQAVSKARELGLIH
ncbi:MAG: response regulator transcription factor [Flavobacteriales bacterium]|nr:response regulator transcription factor [Flavobacteriales bacterium]